MTTTNYRCMEITAILPFSWGQNVIVDIRIGYDTGGDPNVRLQAYGLNKTTNINIIGKLFVGFRRVDTTLEVFFKTISTFSNAAISILNYSTDYIHSWRNLNLVAESTSYVDTDMTVIRDIYNYYDPTILFRRTTNSDTTAASRTFSFYWQIAGRTDKIIKLDRFGTSNYMYTFFMFGRYQSYFVCLAQSNNNFTDVKYKLLLDEFQDDYIFEISEDKQTFSIYQNPSDSIHTHSYDHCLIFGFTNNIEPNFYQYLPPTT